MDAIMLAAGRSTRMGPGLDKQLYRIGGRPMLVIALEKLLTHSQFDQTIVACPPGRRDEIESVVAGYRLGPCMFIEGGQTRQESVWLALQHVGTARVLIHEAARPMVSHDLISRVMAHPDEDAVVPTTPLPFTIAIGDDHMEGELERSRLHNVQLPQVFDTQVVRKAHEQARLDGATSTEDSSLVFRLGRKVKFVQGDVENIKVTWPVELMIVQSLIYSEREIT